MTNSKSFPIDNRLTAIAAAAFYFIFFLIRTPNMQPEKLCENNFVSGKATMLLNNQNTSKFIGFRMVLVLYIELN